MIGKTCMMDDRMTQSGNVCVIFGKLLFSWFPHLFMHRIPPIGIYKKNRIRVLFLIYAIIRCKEDEHQKCTKLHSFQSNLIDQQNIAA